MPDYILNRDMLRLRKALTNFREVQGKFILITEDPLPPKRWQEVLARLRTLPGLHIRQANSNTGLINAICTPQVIRELLSQPRLLKDIIAINDDGFHRK